MCSHKLLGLRELHLGFFILAKAFQSTSKLIMQRPITGLQCDGGPKCLFGLSVSILGEQRSSAQGPGMRFRQRLG